jgi:dihydrofolate synthase/folylpolyglutamate synthase
MGLDRMFAFLERVGLMDAIGRGGRPRIIHIAGTNGKGSTTAFVQSILHAAGERVGGFYSPYVYSPRERIQFGDRLISESEFASSVGELKDQVDEFSKGEFGELTEFELKTALGLLYWKQMGCDWVALEVGLGGRLDATNVVEPVCSVIVSIGLDHMHLLGNTLGEIATEKAGIIKAGKPVVVGHMAMQPLFTIESIAKERGCPIWRYGKEIVQGESSLHLPTRSVHGLTWRTDTGPYVHNQALAIAAIEASGLQLDSEVINAGFQNAYLPGRLQRMTYRNRKLILDGAHNVDAAHQLKWSLPAISGSKLILISGMVEGHDPHAFFAPFEGVFASAHLAPIDFFRGVDPASLVPAVNRAASSVHVHESARAALDAVVEACGPDDVIVVTGSFYLVGAIGNIISAERENNPI